MIKYTQEKEREKPIYLFSLSILKRGTNCKILFYIGKSSYMCFHSLFSFSLFQTMRVTSNTNHTNKPRRKISTSNNPGINNVKASVVLRPRVCLMYMNIGYLAKRLYNMQNIYTKYCTKKMAVLIFLLEIQHVKISQNVLIYVA